MFRALRFTAWGLSLIAFVAQVYVERVRLRLPARSVAADAAFATALAALVLAARLAIRAVARGAFEGRFALALVLWPLLLAIPALVAAYGIALMLRPGDAAGAPDTK